MGSRTVESFEYLYLTDDNFNPKKGTRLRNDIVRVKFTDGTYKSRMYINNSLEYVDFQYDNIMLNELSKITWTKDSKNGDFIKSDADDENLNSLLKRYNGGYYYTTDYLGNDVISLAERQSKRDQFIKSNPYANTENPDGY